MYKIYIQYDIKKKEDYNKKFIKTKWKQMEDVDNDDAIITKTILNTTTTIIIRNDIKN